MAFFSDISQHIDVLRDALGADVATDALPTGVAALDDDVVVGVIAAASSIIRAAEMVRIVCAASSGRPCPRAQPFSRATAHAAEDRRLR